MLMTDGDVHARTRLPAWMRPRLTPVAVPTRGSRSSRGRYAVRRALGGFARTLAEMLTDQSIAEQPGVLQRLDPRAKIIGLLGFLVLTTFLHALTALGAALLCCLALIAVSRIPLHRILRAWLAVPVFTLALALPATLNVVTPGIPVWELCRCNQEQFGPVPLPDMLSVTDHGLYVAGRLVLRTTICVLLALLLTTTTRADRLFRGLRVLGVPQLFIMLLSMMERYLGVILRAANEIHLGKLSRSVTSGTLQQEQRWVAYGMGTLFRRVQALGDAVYLAMLSRGYTGEVYLLHESRVQLRDWGFITVMGVAGIGLMFIR